MPSSRRLTLTPEAEDDLAAIWQYTTDVWGEQKADTYTESIRAKLLDLTHFPGIGRKRDEMAPGLSSFPVGQHIAYYRITDDEVVIRRLIHARQDGDDKTGL